MKNILVVDDNYSFLMGLSMKLCVYLKNFNVLTAGDVRKALKIMQVMPIDLVLTGLEMPSLNGQELLDSVKKSHPALPVFVMTGADGPETENGLVYQGASRCIAKPLDFKQLAEMIASELSGSRLIAA
jgi:DNA-binding NtrC family response regulator